MRNYLEYRAMVRWRAVLRALRVTVLTLIVITLFLLAGWSVSGLP